MRIIFICLFFLDPGLHEELGPDRRPNQRADGEIPARDPERPVEEDASVLDRQVFRHLRPGPAGRHGERQILRPRPGRHEFPRPADRAGRRAFRDEIEDIRDTAAHNARFRRGALRPHRRLPGEVRQGGGTDGRRAAARFHLQLPAHADRPHQGHAGQVDEGVQLLERRRERRRAAAPRRARKERGIKFFFLNIFLRTFFHAVFFFSVGYAHFGDGNTERHYRDVDVVRLEKSAL